MPELTPKPSEQGPAQDAFGLMVELRLSALAPDEDPAQAFLIDAGGILAMALFTALEQPFDHAKARAAAIEMLDQITLPRLEAMCQGVRESGGRRVC
jgi:hypothetical protein